MKRKTTRPPLRIWARRAAATDSTGERLDADRNLEVLLDHWQRLIAAAGTRANPLSSDQLTYAREFAANLPPGGRSNLLDALMLAMDMAELDADFEFGRAVDSERRSAETLDRHRHKGKPRNDPATIARVLATATSNKDAAKKLGVSVRRVSDYKKNAKG